MNKSLFLFIIKINYNIHPTNFIQTFLKINYIKPPIFFKDKALIYNQSRLWNLPKINLILKRLADTEIKCKSGLFLDKLLAAQLILSISVMAKNAIKL